MSQIPRRTSEFQAGSARKPTRSSKIGSAANNPRISQAASARQSTKLSSATPNKTPGRRFDSIRTPNRSERSTFNPSTAEKEKAPVDDKEAILAKSQKIIMQLSAVDGFKELSSKGFKSMTINQFIACLQYFLQPIVGNTPNDFNVTYVDCVHQWLNQLEYPYTISKSSLKTPNAPHCLNSVIVLLSWLQDFSCTEQEPMQCITSEEIPDYEIAKNFMMKIGDMFTVWNNGQIEMEQCIDTINEIYRSSHEGASHITVDLASLQDEIRQLSATNDEHKKVELELNGEFKIVQNLQSKVENCNEELEIKKNTERTTFNELERLQTQLSNQRISKEDRHRLLLEIGQLKSAIAIKHNAILELREKNNEKEILLSNLISKKYQLVDQLNNMIYMLSSELEIAGMADKFDPANFAIVLKKDDIDLEEMLNRLSCELSKMKEKNLKITSRLREKVIVLKIEFNKLSTEGDLCQSKLMQIQGIAEKLTDDEKNIEMMYKSYLHNTQAEHQTYTDRISRVEQEIEDRTKGIDQMKQQIDDLKEKKRAFNAKAIAECERLYEERKQEVESRRQYLTENLARIDAYHKNKKPLPENLQRSLDQILKKRAKSENNENSSKS